MFFFLLKMRRSNGICFLAVYTASDIVPLTLTQPMDPEKKSLNFIFPTQYVIPKSLKFGHWLSEYHDSQGPIAF